ncbi:hypothetical protein ACFRQM_27940 [Streptomyces sp. NPDC056831]|uniref:hypothetical protein n=1 Tax=Streptomyces sp. NPDC056831 TaxID=3345954 RepID=UPI0036AB1809
MTSSARKLTDGTKETWDSQCFSYDALGELVQARTSSLTPATSGTGCKAAGGQSWGYRSDGAASSGPVADAANLDTDTDPSSPDPTLTASQARAEWSPRERSRR